MGDTMVDEKFVSGAFGELRRSLTDNSMVVVPIPPLTFVLPHLEMEKGSALTECEVLAAVEAAPAMTMTVEDAALFAQRPGGADLDPDNIWSEWQTFRAA
jgi:hypothetical protein